MSLIERQQHLITKLEHIYRTAIGGARAGMRSRALREHVEEMRAAGYTKDEAWTSANDCRDMAELNIACPLLAA